MRIIACASASLLALLLACGNDNGDDFAPDGGGGMDRTEGCSVQPTFTSLHDGLFSSNRCAIPGCHGDNQAQGDLDFKAGSAAVYDALLNGGTFNAMANGQFPDRVVTGSSATSYLYVKVSQPDPPGGGSGRMPPGLPLEDCEIEAIRTWIDDGAAND
jgi:hypothetical protein